MSEEFSALVARLEDCHCVDCEGGNCEDVLSRLFALIDDEISVADAHRLLAHAASCDICRNRIEGELAVRKILRRGCCSDEVPQSLRDKITKMLN